jgi:hypothetical protein
MDIPPRITISRTRNPTEELDSAGNYKLIDEKSTRGRGFHRKNGYSAENYQLRDEESTRGMGFYWKLQARRRKIHLRKGIPPGITRSWKLIQTGKIKM